MIKMKRIKWFILLALLCATLFLSKIGCDVVSFSSGFAYPYLVIVSDGYVTLHHNVLYSVAANLVFVVACVIGILKLNLEVLKNYQKKIFISLLFNIVVFNIYALIEISNANLHSLKIVEIVAAGLLYYILWIPFKFAEYIIDDLLIFKSLYLNIASRIYFLVATGFIFLLITLFEKARKKIADNRRTEKSISPADRS